jgi:membrane protease YdiL (CAAX protease family)
LLRQLTAWTQRPFLAILLASLLFGSVHLYEGLGAILPLAALAIVYGLVVRHFKGDLRAVIIAHTLQDFVVALLLLLRPYLERMQPDT